MMASAGSNKQARKTDLPVSDMLPVARADENTEILEIILREVTAIKETQVSIISAQRHLSNQVQHLENRFKRFYARLRDLPLEIVVQIFAWIPAQAVLKFRRLSRKINECLLTHQFAMLNMHMPDLQEESEHSIGGLWLVLPQRYQAAVARVMSGQVKNVVCGEFKDIKKQLPKSISCLTAVDDITLDYCKLTGDIPDVFAALTNLTSLDLKHNSLTGVLPISFSLLSGLRFLDMSGNRLCGEFPALPNTNLETICITCNRFMGPIPTVFRRPSKLTVLQVEYNHFSAIPPSIGQLTSLGELLISGNPISSEIPAEMWNLPAMRVLEMSGCHLFGSLAGIGALRNLWYLNVANNQLGGRLPSREICTMQRLEHLHLSHNQFSGVAGGTLDTSRMPNLTTWSADSGIRSRRCFEAHDSGDDSSGSDPDPEPDSESE